MTQIPNEPWYRQPRWIAVLYFAALVLFPLAYMSMPGEFYFAQYSIARDVTAEQRGLLRALSDSLVQPGPDYIGTIERDNWSVERRGARFTSIRVSNDGAIRLTLSYGVLRRIQGQRMAFGSSSTLLIDWLTDTGPMPDVPGFSAERMGYVQPIRFESPQEEWVQRAIWDSLLWSSKQFDANWSAVTLSLANVRRLRSLVSAEGGDPSTLRGAYLRMLYLSAITITTVGYGDIVPVSTRARISVAAEAVMGIVLIGLFINTVHRPFRTKS